MSSQRVSKRMELQSRLKDQVFASTQERQKEEEIVHVDDESFTVKQGDDLNEQVGQP